MDLYPVIHYKNDDQAIGNFELIKDSFGGCFFISHEGKDKAVLDIAEDIQTTHPWAAIGVNLLRHKPLEAAKLVADGRVSMLWIDQPIITSTHIDFKAANTIRKISEETGLDVLTSVNFKYQEQDSNPQLAAELIRAYGFIPTTSGAGTGEAANIEDVKALCSPWDENSLLAVASGLSADNLAEYYPYISTGLVASSICMDNDFYNFDPIKIWNLKEALFKLRKHF